MKNVLLKSEYTCNDWLKFSGQKGVHSKKKK